MKKYSIHIQGWVYAMTAYGANKRDALNRFKQQHGIARMPRGSAIWETN
jgi:hypothetical protein